MMRVDLNADIGESFGGLQTGSDELLSGRSLSEHRMRFPRRRSGVMRRPCVAAGPRWWSARIRDFPIWQGSGVAI